MDSKPTQTADTGFDSFTTFYPFYLSEHANRTSRRLHVIGTGSMILILAGALISGTGSLQWLLPLVGYGFAWVGHFFFEHNRPATFKHPFYSLMGDFVMFRDVLIRRIPW